MTYDPNQYADQSGQPDQSGQQAEDEDVEIDYEYSVDDELYASLDEIPEELRQGDDSSDNIA
jgi:hypothetical protein